MEADSIQGRDTCPNTSLKCPYANDIPFLLLDPYCSDSQRGGGDCQGPVGAEGAGG